MNVDAGEWRVRIAGGVLLALVLLLYILRIDEVCGSYVDDAYYTLIAKALATGHGFTLLSAPTPGIRPLYPPGYPLLLSIAYRLAPQFPENIPVLKMVSVLAMLGAAVLAWRHGRRVRELPAPLALGVALGAVLHPAFVFLGTATLMSECVFTCVQLAAILAIERGLRREDDGAGGATLFAGGLLAGYAVLVRGLGVSMVIAAAAFLTLRRRWRALGLVVAGALVVLGPWAVDGALHRPTPAEQREVNDYIVHGYAEHFWMRMAGQPQYGDESLADLPARVRRVADHMLRYDFGALLVYPPFRMMEPGTWKDPIGPWPQRLSVVATAVLIVGFVLAARRQLGLAEVVVATTVGVTLLWSYPPFRFVLPLLPFLLSYVVAIVRAVSGARGIAAAGVALAALTAVSLGGDLVYLAQQRGAPDARPAWNRVHAEQRDVAAWIAAHTAPDEVVAASVPAFVSLFADRKTVGFYRPTDALPEWRRLRVRYMVHADFNLRPLAPLSFERTVAYRTPVTNMRVLDVGALTGAGE